MGVEEKGLLEIEAMLVGLLRQVYQLHLDINHAGMNLGDPGESEVRQRWAAQYLEARQALLNKRERERQQSPGRDDADPPGLAPNVLPFQR